MYMLANMHAQDKTQCHQTAKRRENNNDSWPVVYYFCFHFKFYYLILILFIVQLHIQQHTSIYILQFHTMAYKMICIRLQVQRTLPFGDIRHVCDIHKNVSLLLLYVYIIFVAYKYLIQTLCIHLIIKL